VIEAAALIEGTFAALMSSLCARDCSCVAQIEVRVKRIAPAGIPVSPVDQPFLIVR
jgi:hypothetical protein